MTPQTDTAESTHRLSFDITPRAADAGAVVCLTACLTEAPQGPPTTREVIFRDHQGVELARAPLVRRPDGTWQSEPCEVRGPTDPGEHLWQAAVAQDGADPCTADAAFTVNPHLLSVNVWDVPTAIEAGSAFGFRVGIKCPFGCTSEGLAFTVHDHDGQTVATGQVGPDPAPGTTGLHYADVALTAPPTEGRYGWTVTTPATDTGCAHAGQSATVRIQTVPAPEFTLTIEAVDAVSGAPVERAKVVAHPWRTLTDARGMAELRLPRGAYTVFVSGKQYFAYKGEGTLTQDITIRADLHLDREFTEADAWA
ncbi:hypothetical protein RNZ50_21330 [Paracoccaceae bacterium Fryx2]|nr:hypothetical protein [Paracoccaceae bacterium Fryx2]